MTPERHAIQTFERIKAGNFYMVTIDVRPYVDHDLPFDGVAIMRAPRKYADIDAGQQRRLGAPARHGP